MAETPDTTLLVHGKVIDVDNKAVAFANVILMDTDSTFILGGVTDAKGLFKLQTINQRVALLKISAVGYQSQVKPLASDGDMGTVVIPLNDIHLKGVTITRQRPVQRLSRSGIITTIKGTPLELLGNVMDVIEQMPGIRREDNEITVFGKGSPAIYLNGRKITNNNELLRLSSKDIESIEVINNPGAKYGADVKSVLFIRSVKKHGDGWSGSVQAVTKAAHSWSQSDNLSINYRKKGLDLFGAFTFDYARRYQQQQDVTTTNTGKDIYLLNSIKTILPVNTSYVANCGFNWQVNIKNVFGFRYEFQATPYSRSNWTIDENVIRNDVQLDEISYQTHWKRINAPLNSLNMYYIGIFGNLSLTMNNDYYSSRNSASQEIYQHSSSNGVSEVSSDNRIKSTMFASKSVLDYTFGKNSLECGYEYTHTDRTDRYYNHNDLLPNANDNIMEQTIAGFISATFPVGDFELSGGLRYEHTVSDYYQDGELVPEQSRQYNRLFPNFDFTFPIKAARFTLSYTAKTRRPLYSQLSSNIQYDDRYTYETGNPLLQPEMNHDITLAGIYKWIFFSASFQYKKNAIVGIVDPYEAGKPINLMTYRNYDYLYYYSAVLSFSPRISRWSPRLRLNLMGQDFSISTINRKRSMNNPLLFLNFYNSLSLGKGFTVTGDINYHTKGDMDVVTLKPSWQINFGITKAQGHWYFQVNATDIFRTARNSMVTYGSQMNLIKWNYSDSQSIRFTVRYSFNTTMNKYKGRSAGQTERNRL